MAKKKQSVPEYGTVTRKGTLYYRTRITDADGKQVSLYATTCEELYEKQLEAHEALAAALLAQDSGNAETYKAAMQSLLELSKYLTPNDKLLYQSLRALASSAYDNRLVRAVFELKALAVNGEAPNVFSCLSCGSI